jgi:hypothetical protein
MKKLIPDSLRFMVIFTTQPIRDSRDCASFDKFNEAVRLFNMARCTANRIVYNDISGRMLLCRKQDDSAEIGGVLRLRAPC